MARWLAERFDGTPPQHLLTGADDVPCRISAWMRCVVGARGSGLTSGESPAPVRVWCDMTGVSVVPEGLRWPNGVAVVLLVLLASGFLIPSDPAFAAGTPGLIKEASVEAVSPGEAFIYQLVPSCSGLQEGCVNAVLTDVVPDDVVVTALPESTFSTDIGRRPNVTRDPSSRFRRSSTTGAPCASATSPEPTVVRVELATRRPKPFVACGHPHGGVVLFGEASRATSAMRGVPASEASSLRSNSKACARS